MLTECWSCKVMNVTFLEYGLIAYNLLGKSWLSNIVIDLTNARSNAYLHNHRIFLTYKNTMDISYIYHLVVMDSIHIYTQGSYLLRETPYIDSVPVCLSAWLVQTNFDVTIVVNNSHFYNMHQKLMHIYADSPAACNNIIIDNCIFENNAHSSYMAIIAFTGFNKFLAISNCTFKNNKCFQTFFGILVNEITYSQIYNISYKSNNVTIKACTVLNSKCGFLTINTLKGFQDFKTNFLISGPIEITGIVQTDVLIALYGMNVQIMGPIRISNNHFIPAIMGFLTSDVTIAGKMIINSCSCDRVLYLHSDSVYVKL